MKRTACFVCIAIVCLSILQPAVAQTYRIYIDPGHYKGHPERTWQEIQTNLAVGLKLRALLENDTFSGVTWEIRMSRETERPRTVDVREGLNLHFPVHRALDANDFKSDLFISIHCNGGPVTASGTETFWCDRYTERFDIPVRDFSPDEGVARTKSEKGQYLADLVQKHMADHGEWFSRHGGLGKLDRTYETFKKKYSDFGAHLPVLLYLKVPGCLNEIGFVTNTEDEKKLLSDYWRGRFAEAYRDAIYAYFDLPKVAYLEIELSADGWDVISIPGIPVSSYPWSTIIRSDLQQTPPLYQWDPVDRRNELVDTLRFGESYWIRALHEDGEIVRLSYIPKYWYIVELERGFNMIGSVSSAATIDDPLDSPDRSVHLPLYRFNPDAGRFVETWPPVIKPGEGYLIWASASCSLIVIADNLAAPQAFLQYTAAPGTTEVLTNFPNPFNPETWIPFQLKEEGTVTIHIHTTDGQPVRTLRVGLTKPGVYITKDRAAYWDGRNEHGDRAASGIYFYTLQTGSFTQTKKMLLLK